MFVLTAYDQAILDRREARKQATIERNLFKKRLTGVVSHEERASRRAQRPVEMSAREKKRAEKAFAASIGLTWCGTCQEWKDTSLFWKGTRGCKPCQSKNRKSREEFNAEVKQKAQARRNEIEKVRAEKKQRKFDSEMDKFLKKHWSSVIRPLFSKLTKEQYKEQARQKNKERRRRIAMEKSGCSTYEEHLKLLPLIQAATRIGKPVDEVEAHRREMRRRRDQWRGYRKQVKAGMGANGGRIPRGWIDKQKAEQGHQCALCWKPLPDLFEIDHIIPVCFGGENVAENLQLVCSPCNAKKNNALDANFAE